MLDEAVLGSIAYGAVELGIPLVMILGPPIMRGRARAVDAEATSQPLHTLS